MPRKAIREMSERERQHNSLAAKTFHMVLMSSFLLGLISLLVGMGLYAYALGGQYVSEGFGVARSAISVMDRVVDVRSELKMLQDIYESTSQEERERCDEAYLEKFSGIMSEEERDEIRNVLYDLAKGSQLDDLYLGIYDKESNALIYLINGDPKDNIQVRIGSWEHVDPKEIETFMNWDGNGTPYHVSYTNDYGWLCTTGVPVYAREGSVEGFVLADITLFGLAEGMREFVIQYAIAIAAVVLLLGIFLSTHMKKTTVEPINRIAKAASGYASEKKAHGYAASAHFEGLGINTGDEIENLCDTLSDMEKDLNTYERDLTRAIKERERIGTELNLAARIQEDMLPSVFPAFPDRKEFDIFASMIPAKEVGGDFYDYFLIDDDHLAIVMADVSGKGIPAALFMMASDILIKTTSKALKESPAEILRYVNDQTAINNSLEMFVTVWLGILEISTGVLRAANAGHEYPMIRHAGENFELLRDKHGFVIGGMEGMKYTDYTIQLEPGAKLYVYTDGVTEATDENNTLYGTERLLNSLNKCAGKSTKDIINSVIDDVRDFTGNAPQFDDLTSLCLHYTGPDMGIYRQTTGVTEEVKVMNEMTLEATVENIGKVTDFVNEELEALNCPLKAQMQIDIAIDELFGNIALYAYDPSTGPATVRVEVAEDPLAVIITFIDHGMPYDPLKSDDPDITLSAEERDIGGLGVFLVKKTMDEISYEYKDGQNILKIRKNM